MAAIVPGLSACISQRGVESSDDIPPPFYLLESSPSDLPWTRLFNLRAVEDTYRKSEEWWNGYTQLTAFEEATFGNHARALHIWDKGIEPATGMAPAMQGIRTKNAIQVLAEIADTARVIMVNERHHAASDRLLTLELLPELYRKGYRYLAAEGFLEGDSTLAERGYPVIDETSISYTNEPVFGEMIRQALRLGYTLVPYESGGRYEAESGMTREQYRDSIQAVHLVERIFRKNQNARVLVHAGYAHIEEVTRNNWKKMAEHLREMTGINPVTVSQTRLSERSLPEFEHPVYREVVPNEPVVLVQADGSFLNPTGEPVDLIVVTPRTKYEGGRPGWMRLGNRRIVADFPVPECGNEGCFVEARIPGEPHDSVPLDRVEVRDASSVRLFLPPNEPVQIRVRAFDGTLLRETVFRAG